MCDDLGGDESCLFGRTFGRRKIDAWETHWNYCEQALQKISQRATLNQIYLIDTGVGALQTAAGLAYFIKHSSHVICLTGQPEVIYERNKAKFIAQRRQPRPYTEFYNDEFSTTRQSIYSAAQITIDTTLVEEHEALAALRNAIKVLLANVND